MNVTGEHRTCPLDGASLPPGRVICHECEARLRRTLAQAIILQKLLAQAENPLKGGSMAAATAHVAGSRPPLREGPFITRAAMLETLVEMSRVLDVTMTRLPASRRLATTQDIPVYARQVEREVAKAQRILGHRSQLTPWGPCPTCGTPLLARAGASRITCPACHSSFDPATLIEAITTRPGAATNLTEAQLLRALAAAGLPVAESTLRRWVTDGRIARAGNAAGRPTYPLYQALRIVLTRQARKR